MTRNRAEKLIQSLDANDARLQELLSHSNYHVRYKAWRKLGSPKDGERAEQLAKRLTPVASMKEPEEPKVLPHPEAPPQTDDVVLRETQRGVYAAEMVAYRESAQRHAAWVEEKARFDKRMAALIARVQPAN